MSGQGVLTRSERAKNIVSGIRSLTIQNVVNSVLSSVFLALLLRLLSPSDYGLYSGVVLVVLIGSSVASFGLQIAATRFVAFMAYDEGQSKVISRSIIVLSFAFASAATIVLVALSPTLSLYFTRSTGSSWVFAASAAWLFSSTISSVFQGLVQGMKKYESLAKILMSAGLVMVLLTVLGLTEFDSVIIPIIAWVVYSAVICFASLAITRGEILSPDPATKQVWAFKKVLRYSIPLGIAGIVTVVTGAADPLVVGGLLDQTQLGAYNAVIAISGGLGVIFFTPLNTAFFPETSTSAHDRKELSTGLKLAVRYSVLALIPVSFGLAALSTQMINLFSGGGASYLEANLSLQLMSVFFIFVAMQGIPTSILLSTGKTTQVMLIGIVTVLLDVGLSVLLVTNFGLLGATVSRILVDLVGFLMALYLTRNYLAGIIDIGFYAKVLIISAIMFTVLYSLSSFISNDTVTLIPYILIGETILWVCARGFKLLNEADKKYLEQFVLPQFRRLLRIFL